MKRIALFSLALLLASCQGGASGPLVGEWVDVAEDPLGMFLVLREDGTFALGDIQNGERFEGLTGTWTAEGGSLTLEVRTTESCKIKEGERLGYELRRVDDRELVLGWPGSEDTRTFRKSP